MAMAARSPVCDSENCIGIHVDMSLLIVFRCILVPTRASALGLCFLLPWACGGGGNTGPARSRASGQGVYQITKGFPVRSLRSIVQR